MGRLSGVLLTVGSMGPLALLRESLRRLAGVEYSFRGVRVYSVEVFRAVRSLVGRRRRFWVSDGSIYVDIGYGVISVPLSDAELLYVDTLAGDEYRIYDALDVDGREVVDIGAYIGDTAVYFAGRGARRVYAYEPVERYYRLLVRNIELNGLKGRVEAFNAGVWYRNGSIELSVSGGATGLLDLDGARVSARLVDIREVLSSLEGSDAAVKMDCEGCEYSILRVPCELLKTADQYLIEVHGAYTTVREYMKDCGFKPVLLGRRGGNPYEPGMTKWLFTK